MKKNIFKTFLTGAFLALAAVSIPTALNAQVEQLRYQNRYSKSQIGQIISKLESSSNKFRRDFDRELDRSTLNGTSTEDQYNGYIRDYENSLDSLRADFNRNDSWWMVRNEVSDVVNAAQPVNNLINGLPFRRNIERQWNNMRKDLNKLADAFDLPGLNGGGWNGGGWNGQGQTSTPPGWANGTFYTTSTIDGAQVVLTIANNGRVTSRSAGNTSFGTYYNGMISMEGVNVQVYQINNGIRTRRTDNGQEVYYSRNSSGGGYGGGGNTSSPPSWARGTFYTTSQTDGAQIVLTISNNGQVTSRSGDNTSYGTYYNGTISMEGVNVQVYQVNNGIRTRRTDNGQEVFYSRNNSGGGYGGGSGSNASSPPDWARGTFYTISTIDGAEVVLTIAGNGQVTSRSGGNTSYGTYSNGMISMEGVNVRVYRTNNGIRTVREDNGQVVIYNR